MLRSMVAFVIAILSGLGVGSGGLLVIWLTAIEGLSSISARGLNLLFFVFSAGAALVFHLLRKRLNVRLILFMSVFACVGTLIGSLVGAYISAGLLRKIFGAMLVISGSYTLYSRIFAARRRNRQATSKNALASMQKDQ